MTDYPPHVHPLSGHVASPDASMQFAQTINLCTAPASADCVEKVTLVSYQAWQGANLRCQTWLQDIQNAEFSAACFALRKISTVLKNSQKKFAATTVSTDLLLGWPRQIAEVDSFCG